MTHISQLQQLIIMIVFFLCFFFRGQFEKTNQFIRILGIKRFDNIDYSTNNYELYYSM